MKSLVVVLLLVAGGGGVAEGLTREYVLVPDLRSWFDARSYCRQNYRDLATVTTNEENQRLLEVGNWNHGWIGLVKVPSGVWTWSDKEPFSSQNWNGGLPYCDVENYGCCIRANYFGNWNNGWCFYKLYFFCYRYLILVKEKKTWEEALDFCRTNYTGLAYVTSMTSLRQVRLETAGTETESVWTGLRFMEGKWFWVNERWPGIHLGNLVSTMPSCPELSHRCGALNTTTDTFQNQNCHKKLNFVCYWE